MKWRHEKVLPSDTALRRKDESTLGSPKGAAMGRIPGLLCTTRLGDDWIDTGTMCRAQSSPPGPNLLCLPLPEPEPLTCKLNENEHFPDLPTKSLQPAIADPIAANRKSLQALVDNRRISKAEASKKFRTFLMQEIHSYQQEQGGVGFCACASRQMALKHAGIIRPGLSYAEIKRGLRNETSPNATKPGQWEYWHFNETTTDHSSNKKSFSHPSKLHPDAIAQIARNGDVGNGTVQRLRWAPLPPAG